MAAATSAVLCLLLAAPLSASGAQCGPRQYEHGRRCCSLCPENSRMKAPCTAETDTVCQCAPGHWLDRGAGLCRACSQCGAGAGASRPCSPHYNTVCSACPPGTFSHQPEPAGGRECVRCSGCRADQVNIQNCTSRQDTVCMDESFNRLSEGGPSGGASLLAGAAAQPRPADDVSSDIPIYCGILGTVIFVLLLYVAVRHWKLRAAPQKASPPPPPSAVVVARPASASDSSSCPQVEPLFPVPLRKRLADMPATERREVETQLCSHPTNNWSALAAVLGYSKQQVKQIQDLAAQRKTNPARLLMSDWSKRSDASVTSFVHALTMIGRRDLAGLVSPKPVRLTVANVDNFV